ncbi:MAG: radical SAM protein [Candidatus Binatia bacterium]
MAPRSVSVAAPALALAEESVGCFRWGRVADRVLLSGDAGDWAFLSEAEFAELLAGRIAAGHARFAELQGKGFLRDGLDVDALAGRLARRHRHLRRGAHLHLIAVTRTDGETGALEAMSPETAEQVVALALQTTAPAVSLELLGADGEPLRNAAVVRHLVEYARTTNQRAAGKALTIRLRSTCDAMDDTMAEWLLANDVRLSTALDGPADVHDWNRTWLPGPAHAVVVRWIDYFTRRYAELGRDAAQWGVDATLAVTRRTLTAWRETVDEYIARGLTTLHLAPLDVARVAPEAWAAIGYPVEEYLEFYRRTLDYLIERNRAGATLRERKAAVFLTRILTPDDAAVVDVRSPHGAGTGQVAYDATGRVFPNDEARQVDAAGDPFFLLGEASALSPQAIAQHPTVRAIAAASLLDAQPMCTDCWNKPFCGFNPVRTFVAQGDLFGQRPHCLECRDHKAIATRLFELLTPDADAGAAEVLRGWTAPDPRLAGDARATKSTP